MRPLQKNQNSNAERKKDIAIVGMSGKFPKSENIDALWDHLIQGDELIRRYSEEELYEMGIEESLIKDPNFIFANSLLDNTDTFDYSFFGYTKDEAELMDPQIRLMHEQVWLSMEDAGFNPGHNLGKVGLYLSGSDNLNWRIHSMLNPRSQVSSFMAARLPNKSFMSTLISYSLNLKGPSYYLETACSSSLTAVHIACRNLLLKECYVAIAGAASVLTTEQIGYPYEEGMVFSKDGSCRPFDKDSSGTFFGEGAGVVVLKRFEDAIMDNDHIYAVIKATASNNDGNQKVGYTAPSVDGQYQCINLAHRVAGIKPESISYVEAHGTATQLGDSVEIEALNKAFGYNKGHTCAIGSIKSNLGHLDVVAGVAGLIKTSLSLKHKVLPPSINYTFPNKNINFSAGPFYVNSERSDWTPKNGAGILRAGVSSFGIGGANAHVVLEEAPANAENNTSNNPYQILLISAKKAGSLDRYRQQLHQYINTWQKPDMANLAYTLQVGRKSFDYRSFVVCNGKESALTELDNSPDIKIVPAQARRKNVFMFSGGGSQYYRMCLQLYENQPIFRSEMDKGFYILKQQTGKNFASILGYHEGADSELINDIRYMLPAIFMVEYATAKLLMSLGIQPDYMIGHSLGDYTAACISGVFSLEDALLIVCKRGELTSTLDVGGMLGISLSQDKVAELLPDGISIATVNTATSCVVSGPATLINDFKTSLEDKLIEVKLLKISIAAHSGMLDSVLEEFRSFMNTLTYSAPSIPFISNLEGRETTAKEATSAAYWVRHLRYTVNFHNGLNCLFFKGSMNYMEIGSGGTLTSFLKENALYDEKKIYGTNLIRHIKEEIDDYAYLLSALGRLWQHGISINWDHLHEDRTPCKVHAPGYAFELSKVTTKVNLNEALQKAGNFDADQSNLYTTAWKRSPAQYGKIAISEEQETYLYFHEGNELDSTLIRKLGANAKLVEVRPGEKFEETKGYYKVNPMSQADHLKLFEHLENQKVAVSQVVYHWETIDTENLMSACMPIQHICQNLIIHQSQSLKKVTLLAAYSHPVIGNEPVNIEAGLQRKTAEIVIRNNAQAIDVSIDIAGQQADNHTISLIAHEITHNYSVHNIAMRNGARWVEFFDTLEQNATEDLPEPSGKVVYLFLNGLTRIGTAVALYIAGKFRGNIVITGDRSFSQITEGDDIETRNWTQLEATIDQVHYYQADPYKQGVMAELIKTVEEEKGSIRGVVYIENDREEVDMNDFEKLLTRQVQKFSPVLQLHEALKEVQPDFVWVPLRLSSFVNRLNANIYSDTFTMLLARNGQNSWITTFMDDISNVNIDHSDVHQSFDIARSHRHALSTSILSHSGCQVLSQKPVGMAEAEMTAFDAEEALLSEYVAPESELEKALCEMWASFLGRDKIGVVHNFFEMGGNSLKAMTVLKQVQKAFDVQISLKDFFAKPTARLLAEEIAIVRMIKSSSNKKVGKVLKI